MAAATVHSQVLVASNWWPHLEICYGTARSDSGIIPFMDRRKVPPMVPMTNGGMDRSIGDYVSELTFLQVCVEYASKVFGAVTCGGGLTLFYISP